MYARIGTPVAQLALFGKRDQRARLVDRAARVEVTGRDVARGGAKGRTGFHGGGGKDLGVDSQRLSKPGQAASMHSARRNRWNSGRVAALFFAKYRIYLIHPFRSKSPAQAARIDAAAAFRARRPNARRGRARTE
ncbi:hypothetical protein I6G56_21435 [Burkholderia humptydooensis]|uniref:Uncharacterized protein n=1 Tax=Burkholderia humptydooensis TaxID=430531 RepID=A0A7T2U7G0_9BURK|nr:MULTISPECIES: hypothetical protein [Burkholderia]QPS47039.1 hypothetical protein I6G56_21435 [Burkholderia humptydooensis]